MLNPETQFAPHEAGQTATATEVFLSGFIATLACTFTWSKSLPDTTPTAADASPLSPKAKTFLSLLFHLIVLIYN